MAGILELMGHVQQQGEMGRARGLSQLLGKAYNAPPDQRQAVLGQVANVDGGMAMDAQKAFGQQDEAIHDQIIKRAAMVASLYKANPQMAQAAYQGLPELASRGGFGQVPAQLDDKVAAALEQMVTAANQAGGGDDLKSLRIGANGNYWAIRGGQFIDTGTPADPRMQLRDQPGIDPSLVNLRTGAQTPLGGAPQQPQAPQNYAPAPEITMETLPGADVPQSDEVAMLAAAQNEGQAYVPQANGGALPQGAPMGGQGGLAAARPAVTPVQQQQMALAQQAAQRAQEASQRAERGNAPQGYRFKPDGSLEPIPGAPQSAVKPADQVKAEKVAAARADALDSVTQAISGIDQLTKSGGFGQLGTWTGDALSMIPHTKTRDASAALETVKNQVLLTTLTKLKALSATGASGFGALSNQEGNILKNSIANLETAQSHEAIVSNLNTIRQTLERAAGLIGGQKPAQDAPAASGWSIQAVP